MTTSASDAVLDAAGEGFSVQFRQIALKCVRLRSRLDQWLHGFQHVLHLDRLLEGVRRGLLHGGQPERRGVARSTCTIMPAPASASSVVSIGPAPIERHDACVLEGHSECHEASLVLDRKLESTSSKPNSAWKKISAICGGPSGW